MEPAQHTENIFERINAWMRESIGLKLLSIGFLVLILMIPSSWIQSLIEERQQRADESMREVADKWSGSQTISGPVLVIPYKKQEIIDHGKEGKEIRNYVENAFFLPNQLDVNGSVSPEVLHRGIFDAVVYRSSLNVNADFNSPDFAKLKIEEQDVLWNEAYLTFGLTDLRGISDNPSFTVNGNELSTEPSNDIGISVQKPFATSTQYTVAYGDNNNNSTYSSSGIMSKLNWANKESFNGKVSLKLNLKGSDRLDFVPAGKTTTVNLSGSWNDPSFDGEFLPESREITEAGFSATWKVLHYNRPFSQQWTAQSQQLSGSNFGVKLLIPVDQYQKSMRTSKYGALIIILTFIALFLVEITQKIRIHPFQYILIGAALIIYYTLLLSFSEHFGYNLSYLVSSLATVTLISLYATSFLRNLKLVILFTLVLIIFYTFIFVIILQQEFSLVLGSVGLFIIISLLMYFSRKINWYKEQVA